MLISFLSNDCMYVSEHIYFSFIYFYWKNFPLFLRIVWFIIIIFNFFFFPFRIMLHYQFLDYVVTELVW